MGMRSTTKMDDRGRVFIPKRIREAAGLSEGSTLSISVDGEGRIILTPQPSIAERFRGIVKVERWPRDLDEFLNEALRRWWSSHST
ncbi:MAG TPA: AbrB/MazE/SpoVT family DNA-binding domain-containing protein [Candidatus Bathyarchaeota archaeon]|nr:AbrB/MazE/SpoVT family DNA-binding domain-containing protein [Candidatus Bathyarchaeota archaeon]